MPPERIIDHGQPAPQPEDPGIPDFPPDAHLLDYLLLVARHKWAVVWIVGLAAIATLGLTYSVPYSYKADVMLLPPDRLSSSGLLSALNAGGALKILKEVENPSVDLIQNILESRALSERLARDPTIRSYFWRPDERYDDLVSQIQQAIVVQPGYSKVTVDGTVSTGWFSSKQAKQRARMLVAPLVNRAARTMDTIIGEVLRSDAKQARHYADSDYQDRNRELDSLDQVKAAFEEQYGVPDLPAQTRATIAQIGQLEARADDAEMHLNVLERDYSPDDPRVRAARAELEEARATRDQYNVTASIGPSLDTLPAVAREYAEILRSIAILEPIVTFLREERDQQEIFAERVRSVITIVDTAREPDGPFGPKRVPMLALGLLGGGVLSVLYLAGLVFLRAVKPGVDDDSWQAKPPLHDLTRIQ